MQFTIVRGKIEHSKIAQKNCMYTDNLIKILVVESYIII